MFFRRLRRLFCCIVNLSNILRIKIAVFAMLIVTITLICKLKVCHSFNPGIVGLSHFSSVSFTPRWLSAMTFLFPFFIPRPYRIDSALMTVRRRRLAHGGDNGPVKAPIFYNVVRQLFPNDRGYGFFNGQIFGLMLDHLSTPASSKASATTSHGAGTITSGRSS